MDPLEGGLAGIGGLAPEGDELRPDPPLNLVDTTRQPAQGMRLPDLAPQDRPHLLERLDDIASRINARPRRVLDWATLAELLWPHVHAEYVP